MLSSALVRISLVLRESGLFITLLLTQVLILQLEYFKPNFHVHTGKWAFSVLYHNVIPLVLCSFRLNFIMIRTIKVVFSTQETVLTVCVIVLLIVSLFESPVSHDSHTSV